MRKLLVFLFALNLCHAQAHTAKLFYSINTTSGLSSGSITSVLQDATGFIWIGTKNGLNRYDGNDFIHYHSGNSQLSSNDISSLLLDLSGNLWVGTYGGGLYTYNSIANTISRTDTFLSIVGVNIIQIYQHSQDAIWVISEKGLFKIAPNGADRPKEVIKVLDDKLDLNHIEYANGGYWIGTKNGALIFFNDSFQTFEKYSISSDELDRNIIYDIYPVTKDSILVGTGNDGLLTFKPSTSSFTTTEIDKTIVRDIFIDSDRVLWVATDGEGLFSSNSNGKFTQHKHISGSQNSIASNATYRIFEDAAHNIWVGTAWNGISVVDEKTKNYQFYYSDFKGVESSGVLSIYPEDNNLFLGADGSGLHEYLGKENLGVPANSYIQMIKKMEDGYYWIGTFTNGLYRIKGKEIKNYQVGPSKFSISYNDVRDVVTINDNNHLVATWEGGLNLFDTSLSRFKRIVNSDSLQPSPINVVTLEEGADEVWVATFGEGLFSYNLVSQTLKSVPIDLKNIISLSLVEEVLWIGTWGKGLFQYDLSTEAITQISNEILGDNEIIVSILAGQYESVWVATKTGVFKVSQDEQRRVPQLNGEYHINSSAKDAEGTYYFGNTKGVVSFNENILKEGAVKQDLKILGVSLFNNPIDKFSPLWGKEGLVMEHDQNTLTFEYASLNYPTSISTNYQIRLEPLNEDWIDMGNQRSATFANLNAGIYQIQISVAGSSDLVSMDFIILKPWWRRWWAFAIFLTVFGLFLYLFQRYATNWEKLKGKLKIEKITREKEVEIGKIKQKFFINISHEIRTPLTLILGELEHLASKTAGDKYIGGALKKIQSNANHMTQLVNELLDFRKLDSEGLKLNVADGNIVKFTKEIYLSFQNKAKSLGIQFDFEVQKEEISLWFDRDQSEKVIYNLLSNAFKYTPAGGKITLKIDENDQDVFIKIADTGKGITKDQIDYVFDRFYQSDNAQRMSGFGIGLSIVRDIVRLHGGEIGLESEEGKGSVFTIKYLKGKSHFNPDFILPNFSDSEELGHYDVAEPNDVATVPIEEDALLLIVEDNTGIRDFIARSMDGEFRVVKASNGQEALELISQELPDIIITDVMMPIMNGITLLSKIKSERNTSHIPVIVLTARTGLIYKKEGLDIGADDYITKPFNTLLLKTRVRNLLRNQQRLKDKIRKEFLINPKELSINSPDEQFLNDLTQIVDSHINDAELSAELISRKLGMSHSVVYKKLKALTGFKIVEFVRDYRLTQASKLLVKHGFSIADACYKVGFTDRKYFSQVFKKKFGLNPSEYIKKGI